MGGGEDAGAESNCKHLEKRKLLGDALEVGAKAKGCAVLLPDAPMTIFFGGAFRSNAGLTRCFCSAKVKEESIAGRRGTRVQGRAWG